MDVNPLRQAYRELLETAGTVTESGNAAPPAGEWNADQILAHISILTCITLSAVTTVASGVHTTFDNRIAQDTWTIDHIVRLTGGGAGLRDRVRAQSEALCLLAGSTLSSAELDTQLPTRLLSHDTLQIDQPLPLRDLIGGLAAAELPGHTEQLLSLLETSVA